MTVQECFEEINNLEAKLLRFVPRTKEEIAFWDKKRAGIFESVRHLDVAVLRTAFQRLVEDAQSDEKVYFPTVPEILRACNEALDRRPKAIERPGHDPADHKCSPARLARNDALSGLAAVAPYEAKHILCPADVPATCPACGRRRIVTDVVIGQVIALYPGEMTKDWTHNYKGLLLCEKCEKRLG